MYRVWLCCRPLPGTACTSTTLMWRCPTYGSHRELMCWRPSNMLMIAQYVAKYDADTLAFTAQCYCQVIAHSSVCLTTYPQPLPKPVLHTVRSSASSFSYQYPLFSLMSSSSCLHLLPLLPATCIFPSTFPSTVRYRRQFLHKMWPIQLAFLHFTVCRIFLCSLTVCNTSSFLTRSVQLIFSVLLQHHITELSAVSKFQHHTKLCSKFSTSIFSFLNLSPISWWKDSSSCWTLLLPWQYRISFHLYILRHLSSCCTLPPWLPLQTRHFGHKGFICISCDSASKEHPFTSTPLTA